MADMIIPSDPRSASAVPSDTTPASQPPASPSPDSMAAFSSSQGLLSNQLEAPSFVFDGSMTSYFKAVSGANAALRQRLAASDQYDQNSRGLYRMNTAAQATILTDLLDQKAKAMARIKAEAQQAIDTIKSKLSEMENAFKAQQQNINNLNGGNEFEKQKFQELTQAYNKYLEDLKSIGVVYKGNGNFDIPKGAESKFNEITAAYQGKVNEVNGYLQGRVSQINQYNAATTDYNQKVAALISVISDLVNKYQLSDYMKQNGINISLPAYAQGRNPPGLIASPPSSPSNEAYNIAANGPPAIPSLPGFSYSGIDKLQKGIYDALYNLVVIPIQRDLENSALYWQFMQAKIAFDAAHDTIPDPVLNTKPLTQKILPEAFITPPKEGGSPFSLQTLGVDRSVVSEILGRSLLRQTLENVNLAGVNNLKGAAKEQKIEELVDKLQVFSVALLGNQSLQSLFPSLGPLSKSLASLPADSPVFGVLFAISFANRIQEDSQPGINGEALEKFLNGIPEFKNLSEGDRSKIETILNGGQLLIAAKLLESNLGLPGLTAQLLQPLSPSAESQNLMSDVAIESKKNLEQQQTNLETHFLEKGYKPDQAGFLAQVGTQLTEQGTSTPSVSSIPTPQAINQSLLLNSIKASLVLDKVPLEEADSIAREAVTNTLAEAPFPTTKQFRSNLEKHLGDLGFKEKSVEIARQAILIPPEEKEISLLAASSTVPSVNPQLSQEKLMEVMEKRTIQLLTPQLGIQFAKEIAKELSNTLFGPAQPASPAKDLQSPYALTNVIKNQLYHLRLDDDKAMTTKVVASFKEAMKINEVPSAFLLKLMEPASLFIYTGMIYGNRGLKKPVDIPI